MKVCLIRTPSVISASEVRPGCSPPLGLAYLAGSLLRAGHQVSVVDAIGEALQDYSRIEGVAGVLALGLPIPEIVSRIPADTDLLAVTCMFSTEWPMAKRVIQACREFFREAPIIAGGEHITACPEFVMEDCPALTFCGLGEGETLITELADTLEAGRDLKDVAGLVFREAGKIHRNTKPTRIRDVDQIPLPAWHLFPINHYIESGAMPGVDIGRSMPLLASRGCPYECTFCSNPAMWGRLWKPRTPQNVLDEMKHWVETYRVTNFDFYDLTAIVRKDWILDMSRLIITSGLKITWQLPSGTRSEALDREVVDLLFASGCRNVIYAPESGSEYTLKRIKKKIDKKAMAVSVNGAVKAGIKTKANFIVGFPGEKIGHVFESYGYAIRLAVAGLHEVSFFPFSPYPGSALFDELMAKGKIRLSDTYFFNLVTNPRCFSEYIPSWLAPILASFGMSLFFFFSFALHPWRLIDLARAMMTRRPKTRLESALLRLMDRAKTNRSNLPYYEQPRPLPSKEAVSAS